MKTFKKTRVLAFVLAVLMAATSVPYGNIGWGMKVAAANYSGSCGGSVNWSLDTATGILSITGSGDMADYTIIGANPVFKTNTPWYGYKASIREVVVSNGVTSIGAVAFDRFQNLAVVTLPDSITKIGYRAFAVCDSLASVTIPKNVTQLESQSFYHCDILTSVTFAGTVAPQIGSLSFGNTAPGGVVYFPSDGIGYGGILSNFMNSWTSRLTREATPNASIDYVEEQLTGLTPGTYIFNGTEVYVGGTVELITSDWMNGNSLSIRRKGDGISTSDSLAQYVRIPVRPAAPTGLVGVNESVGGANNGKITGVTTAMEHHRTGGDFSDGYAVCPDSELTGLAATKYYVRYKAVSGVSFASGNANVTIGTDGTGTAVTRDLTLTLNLTHKCGVLP